MDKKLLIISFSSYKYDVWISCLLKDFKFLCRLIYEYLKAAGILLILAILLISYVFYFFKERKC